VPKTAHTFLEPPQKAPEWPRATSRNPCSCPWQLLEVPSIAQDRLQKNKNCQGYLQRPQGFPKIAHKGPESDPRPPPESSNGPGVPAEIPRAAQDQLKRPQELQTLPTATPRATRDLPQKDPEQPGIAHKTILSGPPETPEGPKTVRKD